MSANRPHYLIIGGAPKSGTTSLFRYLTSHPQICPASKKETYFFAREFDYRHVCNVEETLDAFESYYAHCSASDGVKLEATPYTLYTADAAQKIAALLPDSVVYFSLRDPIARLKSDYHFHVQREHPSAQGTFEDFINRQFNHDAPTPSLLQLGCYIQYLQPFIQALGRDRVKVIIFEELIENPGKVLDLLCQEIGIDPGVFGENNYNVHNKTLDVRSARLNRFAMWMEPGIADLRSRIISRPTLSSALEAFLNVGKSGYRTLNGRKQKAKQPLHPDIWAQLAEYYRPHSEALSLTLGRSFPWPSLAKSPVA